jgi:hypothetical protein
MDRRFDHKLLRAMERNLAMNQKVCLARFTQCFSLCVLAVVLLVGCHAKHPQVSTEFVRYGGMHETVGQKQHHSRVALAEIVERPHFYGIGALAGLQGEITIQDSVATVTSVAPDGRPQTRRGADMQATLLVGKSIEDWASRTLGDAVWHAQFDAAIAAAAAEVGLDVAIPFMFVIEGEFTDLRLHVINGACPVHARMKNLTLDHSQRPFELEAERLTGTLVGVYAADAVGKLTHPATSTHVHVVYVDHETEQRITGHLERVGLAAGAVLKLPKPRASGATAAVR